MYNQSHFIDSINSYFEMERLVRTFSTRQDFHRKTIVTRLQHILQQINIVYQQMKSDFIATNCVDDTLLAAFENGFAGGNLPKQWRTIDPWRLTLRTSMVTESDGMMTMTFTDLQDQYVYQLPKALWEVVGDPQTWQQEFRCIVSPRIELLTRLSK